MLFPRIIRRAQAWTLEHPRTVVGLSGVLFLIALALASRVELRTSRSDLAPPGDPEQMRFDAVPERLKGTEALIACVEADPRGSADPERLRSVADEVASALREAVPGGQVFHRIDVDWFLDRGVWLAPPADLERGVGVVRDLSESFAELGDTATVAGFNEALAERLRRGASGTGGGAEGSEEGAERLAEVLRAERRFLEEPEATAGEWSSRLNLRSLARRSGVEIPDGYLATADAETLFVLAIPEGRLDGLPPKRDLLRTARRSTDRVLQANPGFRVAFTGEPARVVEEMGTISRDTRFTTLVALAGVTLLTVLVFRWKTHALLVLAALAHGIVLSVGAVELELGYLNLITSAFISTLIGVGVAYGIHPVSEYELQGAHTGDPLAAVLTAYHRTGAAVTVAAVTTSAAFFSILLMDFRGFSELGLVAGTGVLLCLLSCLVLLPAILVLYGNRRRRRDRAPRSGAASAAVDRLWVERGAEVVCRFPRATSLVAIVVTAIAIPAATGIAFDTDMIRLLPRGAESVRFQERMIFDSEISPISNLVLADDLAELRRLERIAEIEPTVARVDSALRFLPRDPQESARQVAALREALRAVGLPGPGAPEDPARLLRSLDVLEEQVLDAADAAFAAGLGETAAALEGALAAIDATREVVQDAPPDRVRAWAAARDLLVRRAGELLERIRRSTALDAPSPSNLPEELRSQFVTPDGRFLARLQPAGSVFDPGFLDEYVQASRRISAESTGFPIVFHRMSERITSGFRRAVIFGALMVVVLLVLDFRNVAHALLALIPLAMGVVWMLGGMRLFGLSFNFANLVAVPLILGVGIDNGVHIVHRFRLEGRRGMAVVLRHTGRAILIASLTTMIGFGSLALASHRGLSSLGKVLLLGVGACLVTSMVVLPNLLLALGVVKDGAGEGRDAGVP